ncbi:hypothetical protein MO989_22400 [Vibrio vulnificus]|nr:hypothetical protein [Vibrio vulnificus]
MFLVVKVVCGKLI